MYSKFRCDICKKNYSYNHWKRHISLTHAENDPLLAKYGCDLCEGIFVLEMSLSKHKFNVHNVTDNRTFQCLNCPYKSKIGGMHRHVMVNHEKGSNETFLFYALIPGNIQENGKIQKNGCNQTLRTKSRTRLIKNVTSEDELGSEKSVLDVGEELNDSIDEEYLQKPKAQKIDKFRKWIKHF